MRLGNQRGISEGKMNERESVRQRLHYTTIRNNLMLFQEVKQHCVRLGNQADAVCVSQTVLLAFIFDMFQRVLKFVKLGF